MSKQNKQLGWTNVSFAVPDSPWYLGALLLGVCGPRSINPPTSRVCLSARVPSLFCSLCAADNDPGGCAPEVVPPGPATKRRKLAVDPGGHAGSALGFRDSSGPPQRERPASSSASPSFPSSSAVSASTSTTTAASSSSSSSPLLTSESSLSSSSLLPPQLDDPQHLPEGGAGEFVFLVDPTRIGNVARYCEFALFCFFLAILVRNECPSVREPMMNKTLPQGGRVFILIFSRLSLLSRMILATPRVWLVLVILVSWCLNSFSWCGVVCVWMVNCGILAVKACVHCVFHFKLIESISATILRLHFLTGGEKTVSRICFRFHFSLLCHVSFGPCRISRHHTMTLPHQTHLITHTSTSIYFYALEYT